MARRVMAVCRARLPRHVVRTAPLHLVIAPATAPAPFHTPASHLYEQTLNWQSQREALTRFRFARLCTKLASANAACKTRVNMKCVRASQRRVVRVAVRPHGTDYIAGTTEVTPARAPSGCARRHWRASSGTWGTLAAPCSSTVTTPSSDTSTSCTSPPSACRLGADQLQHRGHIGLLNHESLLS